MQAAFIIMTILGCDDTATQCHFVEMLDERWATVQACDAGSEDRLKNYSNINYPVVVAVCQTPGDTGLADAAEESMDGLAPPVDQDLDAALASAGLIPKVDIPPAKPVNTAENEPMAAETSPGMTTRVLNLVKEALPETARLKALVSEPVHVVTDSYSWVVQRFEK